MFDQWNVSLKLAHSGVAAEVRVRADAIAAFRDRDAWFKFVVATERDVDEVLQIQAAHRVPSRPLAWELPPGPPFVAKEWWSPSSYLSLVRE